MTYTLMADGASDRVLVPFLTWSLRQNALASIVSQWADLGRIPRRPDVDQRVQAVLDLYPCDILFVHRDAEARPASARREEIASALRWAKVRHVPVVPVRMTEAWLLVDEIAIRWAAGNPRGTEPLNLPSLSRIEDLPDPKRVLFDALNAASGLNTRRRSKLPVHQRAHRIPDYMRGYSCLTALSAFRALQRDIREAVQELTVNRPA